MQPPQAPCKYFYSSSSSSSSPPSLSFYTLDSRPFHLSASHLAWKTRPAPSHTLLICLTSLAMWLLNLFSCLCVCVVSVFLTFFALFLLCLSLLSLSAPSVYCCGTSPLCLYLLVGQCQGVRKGQQLGMGMMGGVLIAVTA